MPVAMDIFATEHYVNTRKPLDEASALPGWCYTSPEWYQREVETLFRKDWLCVGRVEQIPKPGDFFSIEIVDQPMIVVRDEDGEVRVHSAICRHRGAVITQHSGRCRQFVCPYHNWTYSLSGKLVSIPGTPHPMAASKRFAQGDYSLSPIRAETWGGFIFINFDDHAEPLLEWLGDLPEFLGDYGLENMQWTHKDVIEVDCNWKVWLENALESYHVYSVHRKHAPKGPQNWVFQKSRGPWEGKFSGSSLVGYSGLPKIAGVDEQRASGLYHLWIQPSVQLIVTGTYVKFRQYFPLGPEKLRLYENWMFPKQTVESSEFGTLTEQPLFKKFAEIIQEDVRINPIVQKGLRSGVYKPGRYSIQEHVLHRAANRVLDRVIGPDDPKARAARDELDVNSLYIEAA